MPPIVHRHHESTTNLHGDQLTVTMLRSLRLSILLLEAIGLLACSIWVVQGVWVQRQLNDSATQAFEAKDVVADILPPPLYLIELCLILSQAVEGKQLVRDAGSAMSEILSSVHRVSSIIAEITTAMAEQSTGLGHLDVALAHLDEMTRQNATLVEASASAAADLRTQADRLSDVVSTFQLDSV